MKTMEDQRKARRKWDELYARHETTTSEDMDEWVSRVLKNFLREDSEKEVEPKPRWRDRTYGNTYAIYKVNDGWAIWFVANRKSIDHQSTSIKMNKTFPSMKEANDVLDNYCIKYSDWERCDEVEAPQDSYDEVLAEIQNLRDQLGLGVIFGRGNGQWGLLDTAKNYSFDLGAQYTLPELLDILQKRAKPEPVTNKQAIDDHSFLESMVGEHPDAVNKRKRLKRFFDELIAEGDK